MLSPLDGLKSKYRWRQVVITWWQILLIGCIIDGYWGQNRAQRWELQQQVQTRICDVKSINASIRLGHWLDYRGSNPGRTGLWHNVWTASKAFQQLIEWVMMLFPRCRSSRRLKVITLQNLVPRWSYTSTLSYVSMAWRSVKQQRQVKLHVYNWII
jgi:hypothetical protein